MVISLATIGTSWITEDFIEAAEATGNWKLLAVYSRSAQNAESFARKYGVIRTYSNLEQMCLNKDIDAVYIASPNNLHFDHAKLVLAAGKHAIVEKPLVSNIKEFDELSRIAQSAPNGAKLIEAYRHIQENNFKILKRSLSSVGRVYGGHLAFANFSSRFTSVLQGQTPNVFSKEFSGGCITDTGVYPICLALALFGRPLRQIYRPILLHTGTDAGGPIMLEYEGFTISIQISKCYNSSAVSEIFGEKGTLAINSVTDIESIQLSTISDKKVVQLAESKAALNLMEEAQEFYRLITEDDLHGIKQLEDLSRLIVEVTEDLRRQNGILFAADL